jgi:malonate decarboxylase gamma subunit
MDWQLFVQALFPHGHTIAREGDVIAGNGAAGAQSVAVIGTVAQAYIGTDTALALAAHVLAVVREQPGRPILLLVDTRGQRLSRRDELLGIHAYLAHLSKCLHLARTRGHRVLSLAYGEAVSGGYLAGGMMADQAYALPDAQVRVMNLPAMARVTKIPLPRLEALSATSPVFAPGVDNFLALGGIEAVWMSDLAMQLQAALAQAAAGDLRRHRGAAHGGRRHAAEVANRVCEGGADDRA